MSNIPNQIDLELPFVVSTIQKNVMIEIIKKITELMKLDKLDSVLFKKEIHMSIKLLNDKKYEEVSNKLREISDALRIRAVITPLLDVDSDKDSFEITSLTVKKFADIISKFDTYDTQTQKRIANDLKLELTAIELFLANKEKTIKKPQKVVEEITENEIALWSTIHKFNNMKKTIKKKSYKHYTPEEVVLCRYEEPQSPQMVLVRAT